LSAKWTSPDATTLIASRGFLAFGGKDLLCCS
jgi:hypothetical protein